MSSRWLPTEENTQWEKSLEFRKEDRKPQACHKKQKDEGRPVVENLPSTYTRPWVQPPTLETQSKGGAGSSSFKMPGEEGRLKPVTWPHAWPHTWPVQSGKQWIWEQSCLMCSLICLLLFFESQTVKAKIPRLSLYQYVEIQNFGSGWAGYEKPKFFLRTEMKTECCEETRNLSKWL